MGLGTFLQGRNPTLLRGVAWLTLSEVGNVLSPVGTDDAGGGITHTWTTASTVPCKVEPVGPTSRGIIAERINERSTHSITVPRGTSISTKDRFYVQGRGTFSVTEELEQTSELVHIFEVRSL